MIALAAQQAIIRGFAQPALSQTWEWIKLSGKEDAK
jgi:hypothetical protein